MTPPNIERSALSKGAAPCPLYRERLIRSVSHRSNLHRHERARARTSDNPRVFISGATRNSNRSDYCVEGVVIAPDSGSLTPPRADLVPTIANFRIAEFHTPLRIPQLLLWLH